MAPLRPLARQLAFPALFAILGLAALSVDMPIARWVDAHHVPNELKKICDLTEVFGHFYGEVGILLAVWVLAPGRRWGLPRVAVGTVLAGIAVNLVKMSLSRRRPIKMDDLDVAVLDTFQGWFPFFSAGSAGQAFPSGHTATAIALALGLAWLLPRGKWLFAGLALLATAQRMVSGYHYLSDTLWAAALGWLCASACLPGGWLTRPFDRLDRWLTVR